MFVLGELDGRLANHLLRALGEHRRWCRVQAVPFPVELDDLITCLSATDGQRRPSLPVGRDAAHAEGMLLAVDFATAGVALGVSERTVRRLVADGRLSAVSVAGCRRVRRVDLERFVDGLGGAA